MGNFKKITTMVKDFINTIRRHSKNENHAEAEVKESDVTINHDVEVFGEEFDLHDFFTSGHPY